MVSARRRSGRMNCQIGQAHHVARDARRRLRLRRDGVGASLHRPHRRHDRGLDRRTAAGCDRGSHRSDDQTQVTDAQGQAHFLNLPVGIYAVKAELSGFNSYANNTVQVVSGGSTPLAVRLGVAGTAETINVTAASRSSTSSAKRRRPT